MNIFTVDICTRPEVIALTGVFRDQHLTDP